MLGTHHLSWTQGSVWLDAFQAGLEAAVTADGGSSLCTGRWRVGSPARPRGSCSIATARSRRPSWPAPPPVWRPRRSTPPSGSSSRCPGAGPHGKVRAAHGAGSHRTPDSIVDGRTGRVLWKREQRSCTIGIAIGTGMARLSERHDPQRRRRPIAGDLPGARRDGPARATTRTSSPTCAASGIGTRNQPTRCLRSIRPPCRGPQQPCSRTTGHGRTARPIGTAPGIPRCRSAGARTGSRARPTATG